MPIIVGIILLVIAGAVSIRFRWRRTPHYRAMIVVAACYLVAGVVLGSAITRRVMLPPSTDVATNGPTGNEPAVVAPKLLLNRFPATVVSIMEGDTIVVADSTGTQGLVRLFGIDAPELGQPFAAQSTQHLAALVSGKNVLLECEKQMSYERMICKVLLTGGEDLGLHQVKAGMAWHYKQYEDQQSATDRDAYAAAECTAMKSKIGLWRDPHPRQPVNFRNGTNSPLLFDASGCPKNQQAKLGGAVVGNASSYFSSGRVVHLIQQFHSVTGSSSPARKLRQRQAIALRATARKQKTHPGAPLSGLS